MSPMSEGRIVGLHHMSATCGPAQENLDFYVGVLGFRLLKLTVNYDDPTAYHLYYGDGVGSPGTVLTFFPYPDGYPGRPGTGQATITGLQVGPDSLRYWYERLKSHSVDVESPRGRTMDFHAPDGLKLRLIANGGPVRTAPHVSRIPAMHAIGAMRAVVLEEESAEKTEQVLIEVLGMVRDSSGFVFPATGDRIDLSIKPGGPKGRQGRGSVHHIAFRTADLETLTTVRDDLLDRGFHASQVMDRSYFKSVYFREPGGTLFEIATDGPGFAVDESVDSLGTTLKLPPQFEPYRSKIERSLPKLRMPT